MTVVTDSAAALSQEQIDEFQLFVARMEIVIDGSAFTDGSEGDLNDFYSHLNDLETEKLRIITAAANFIKADVKSVTM